MKKRILHVFISVVLVLSVFVMPASALTQEERQGAYEYYLVDRVARIVEYYYKFGTTREDLVDAALYRKMIHPDDTVEDLFDEMLSSLDPHSSYLYEDDYNYMKTHTLDGEFVGIGVSIVQSNGKIIVVSPIKGSPAEAAGLATNDIIISADGIDLSSSTVDYAQSVIVGEEGTVVKIDVLRGDQILSFDIPRAKIKDVSVSYSIIDNIGYLSVTNFNANTVPDTKTALSEFDKNGITKIIIDLRNNPGGELNSIIEFSNLFVPKGAVAHVKYKDSSQDETFYSKLKNPKYKLALLVNGGTASAAEMFSAAVQDTGVGKLFGTRTYGKGTMQSLIPFSETGGALRLTVAEFLSAKGNTINEVGVTPDYPVKNSFVTKDSSYFVSIDFSKQFTVGSESDGVLAVEQRLEFLGYFVASPDKVYDSETASAVTMYQTYRGLNATGNADVYTLLDLNNIEYEKIEFTDDKQFDAALEYIKSLK